VLSLKYAPPPADLAEYISAFYLFECDEGGLEDIERADIAQFRIILDGEAQCGFPDGSLIDYPRIALFGPRLTATTVKARSDKMMRLFGCGILPAGWTLSVRKPAHECANKIFPATDVLSGDFDGYAKALGKAKSFEEMVEISVANCRAVYAGLESAPLWFIRAVDKWLESSISPDIADLEAATGLSRRQIERQCKQTYGAPPKFLVRKYRALRTANAIANGNEDWQNFVDEAYYDQPHFIREIKAFTGMTPGAIRNSSSRISQLTFGRAALAGDVKPLVSQT
jgi:AraC-like DNA-binding protein